MATVREKICEAGVNTLREFMCTGGIGGGITYTGQIISVHETQPVQLLEYNDSISICEKSNISVSDVVDRIAIISTKEDEIDGV